MIEALSPIHECGIWGQGVAPRLYAVSVGHFTHFAFTVNFTHCVKTKPDSGFTVKSRTLRVKNVIMRFSGKCNDLTLNL